jgi:hypothetical protein
MLVLFFLWVFGISEAQHRVSRRLLLQNRHSTSLRFPFAYLANKRRKVVITPDSVNDANPFILARVTVLPKRLSVTTGIRL